MAGTQFNLPQFSISGAHVPAGTCSEHISLLNVIFHTFNHYINECHFTVPIIPYIISPHLFVQAAAIPISTGVTMDGVLIQHWPAIEYLMIAVITVMREAAHVS